MRRLQPVLALLLIAQTSLACELPGENTIFNYFHRQFPTVVTSVDFNIDDVPLMPRGGVVVGIGIYGSAREMNLTLPPVTHLESLALGGMSKVPGCSALTNDQLRDTFGIPTPLVRNYRFSPRCIARALAVSAKNLGCRIR